MKFLRYVNIIAFGVIILPFLGVSTMWKHIIFVVFGCALLALTTFMRQREKAQNPSPETEDSGASFQDSEPEQVEEPIISSTPEPVSLASQPEEDSFIEDDGIIRDVTPPGDDA